MRASKFYLNTLKEAPAEADVTSQKLMLRSGMIKKLSSGIYSWLPLGLVTLRKTEQIVREEMNRAGALECYLPHVIPAELWQETGRWDKFGPQLLKIRDRHERDFLFGPTHKEPITDIVRKEEAKETGAEAVVTCCPYCEQNLADPLRADGEQMKIYDLTDLMLQSM